MGDLPLTFGMWWQKCYVHRRVPNHLRMEQQETAREITNPNPNKKDTEMMISCRMWTTSPQTQILLKASLRCTFLEDNEAVIKMIIKGKSPTKRPVSRTHRVALDWFFDRITLDPKIQIKDVDTKNQLADMLTKSRFTRDEWDHLLRLLNSMNVSMFSCSHFLPNRKQTVLSKRAPESTAEKGSVVAKRRPMSLMSRNLPSAKKTPPARFECYEQPGESRVGSELCFIERQETGAKQPPRPNSIFSREATRWHSIFEHRETGAEWWICKLSEHQETGARRWQWNRKDEDGLPQYANLRPSIPWKSLRDWHWNMKPKFWMYRRLVGQVPHGRDLRLHKRKQSSGRKQKYTCTQIPSCAWGWCKSIQKRTKDGMINLKNFNNPILTENYLELMEKRLSSSGIFPKTYFIGDPPDDTKKTCKIKTLNLRILKNGSSSCQCSMTSTKTRNSERCISNSEHVKNSAERFSRGHWKFLGPSDEKKWYGTLSYTHEGKWDSIATEMVGRRDTIHFNADSSNKKNLFRTIHSANQLSICGAVSSWCEEFAQRTPNQKESASEKFARTENEQLLNNVEPQEVNCSVQTPRSDNRESGNRLRECLQRRETLEKEIQFSRVCEDATIARRVRTGMSYKTVPDVDDGFEDRTPACREYTLPREDQNSRIYATIPGQTIIGPVLQAHILRYLGISGLEIQIPSTTTKNRTYWLVICRGKNPLRGRVTSQWSRPQSHKFWTAIGKICCKRKRTWFDKDGAIIEHRGNSCETVENSDESSVQLFRRISSYRGKEVARHSSLSTIQRKHFWSRSLKIGHEIGSWRAQILGLWLASAYFYKRSNKTRFQHCKNSRDVLLYIRAIQGHNGGNLIVPELMGHVAIPNTWKEFLLHRGCSRDVTSILKSRLIAVGRASKEGRQTIFFTPLNPPGHNPDEEEPGDDLSKPRQIHYYSKWEPRQDAVFWINLARAQDKGLQFWQTRTHAVIVYSSVPADCIYKVMSQNGKNDIWKTLDASSCTEDSTQEWHTGESCFKHQETGA